MLLMITFTVQVSHFAQPWRWPGGQRHICGRTVETAASLHKLHSEQLSVSPWPALALAQADSDAFAAA